MEPDSNKRVGMVSVVLFFAAIFVANGCTGVISGSRNENTNAEDWDGATQDGSVVDGAFSDGFVADPDAGECIPSCEGVECGQEDPCGNICEEGSGCICVPDCEGKTCGSDNGCGEPCQPGSGCHIPQPEWTFHGQIAEGVQFDAVRGPGDIIHIVSNRYYQLNASGQVIVDEDQGDGQQNPMHFPPAIAAGDDGTVHIVTRHEGNVESGFVIRYRRRNTDGTWDSNYVVGSQIKRNYVVAAAWAGIGQVHMFYSQMGDNVWGPLHFFYENGGSAATDGLLDNVWRADNHARMRGRSGTVYFVSGKGDPDGRAYFSWGSAGAGLSNRLAQNMQQHTAGSGRRSFPDLYIDAQGDIHFIYGAHHQIYYNRYNDQGQRQLSNDGMVFDGLGDWHLSTGLGAVAATDDGQTILIVALRSDGSQAATNSDVLWSFSTDAGQTWSTPVDSGRKSNAGEGRRLPRIVALNNTFFVIYQDNGVSGLSLATVETVQ